MKIYLIRHGDRVKHQLRPDVDEPLTPTEEDQVKALARKLQDEGVPTLFLSSRYNHALQTGKILQATMNPNAPLISLKALTPIPADFALTDISCEVNLAGQDLSHHNTVAMIMHHPRQTQLGMILRGVDYQKWRSDPELQPAEAICLTAETLEA